MKVTQEQARYACEQLEALKAAEPLDDYHTLTIVACVVDSINRSPYGSE